MNFSKCRIIFALLTINQITNQKQEVTMKATKIVMIVALVAFATLVFSKPDPGSLTVKIWLSAALHNQALVKAMHVQLDRSLIAVVAKVKLGKITYAIFGRYEQWKAFFSSELNEDPVTKKPGMRLASRVK